jgi:hypothetical protein
VTPPGRALTIALALLIVLAAAGAPVPRAADTPVDEEAGAVGRTPPRLSFVDGQVSFWRPGAEEWAAARVNTALAPGDELYTGAPGNLELQIGARAYVRAWGRTQLGLAGLEPDFVQVKVTTGHVSLDLRRVDPGHTVEVDTPNAAFTIEHAGYYRIDVSDGRTSFITRRGGRATVTPASGTAATLAPSEEVVVEGTDALQISTYVAPELDAWDRWNYARTEALLDSPSGRYVAAGVYGIDDLDHHGSWRVVETYGPVWVPTGVAVGWVPYGTGSWTWDPFYGWTWVDAAPWGWAPYHHGRWVYLSGVWAWAPGPLVLRPVYAPALVAFLGPRSGVTIGVTGPAIGWVALGWGEPIIPWWGPAGFVGVPRWAGWGGPRIVNNVLVARTTVVHAHEIHAHRNTGVPHAITAVPRDRFGRGPVARARVAPDPRDLEPIRGKPDAAPARASLVPDATRGARPPEAALRRPVVATRPPDDPARWPEPHGIREPARTPAASPRLVPAPRRVGGAESPPRPPFGASPLERPRSAPPPRPDRAQPPSPAVRTPAPQPAPSRASPGQPSPAPPAAPRAQRPASKAPALPGEPANRLFPGRAVQAPGRTAPPPGQAPTGGRATPAPRQAPRPAQPGR